MNTPRKGALWAAQEADQPGLSMQSAVTLAAILIALIAYSISSIHPRQSPETVKQVTYVTLNKESPPPPPTEVKPILKELQQPPSLEKPQKPPQAAAPIPMAAPTPTPVASITTTEEPSVVTAEKPSSEKQQVVSQASSEKASPQSPAKGGKTEIGLVCQTQVKPEIPRKALLENISGSVVARATIKNGVVINVDIIKSSPKGLFDAAVKKAMLQYRCDSSMTDEVTAEQNFAFGLE